MSKAKGSKENTIVMGDLKKGLDKFISSVQGDDRHFKINPDIFKDNPKDDQGPSCSLAEALGKQDLFINTNLANAGLAILWKMFRELHIKNHGCYVNLETGVTNPIKIR